MHQASERQLPSRRTSLSGNNCYQEVSNPKLNIKNKHILLIVNKSKNFKHGNVKKKNIYHCINNVRKKALFYFLTETSQDF